jgi:CP family cyanate transporter-like MFS transporter
VILLRAHPPGSGGARAQVPALWRDRTAVAITAVLGLQSALYYAVTAWLPTLLTDPPQIGGIGAGPGLAGVALSVFQLLGIIGTLAVAPLTRLGRDQRWLAVGAGLSWLLLLGGLLVAPHWWPVWAVLGGLTQGAGISLSFALLVLRSPDAQVAAAMSSFAQFCGYLLGAAGPVLLGAVYQSSGRWTPGLLSLGVLAVAMAAAGWVAGSRRPIGG